MELGQLIFNWQTKHYLLFREGKRCLLGDTAFDTDPLARRVLIVLAFTLMPSKMKPLIAALTSSSLANPLGKSQSLKTMQVSVAANATRAISLG